MTAPAIDRATFEALEQTTGAEFVLELIDTFLQEAPSMLNDLRDALAAKDADKFRRTAHSLKSNSNTFGALALGAMARDLELGGMSKVVESSWIWFPVFVPNAWQMTSNLLDFGL